MLMLLKTLHLFYIYLKVHLILKFYLIKDIIMKEFLFKCTVFTIGIFLNFIWLIFSKNPNSYIWVINKFPFILFKKIL